MSGVTWGEIKEEVQEELNLFDENYVTPAEMLGFCKDALREAEAEIHKLGIEDLYFEASNAMHVVEGRRDYALPSDIYANKITRIMFSDGTLIYDIERMTKLRRYQDAEYTKYYSNSDRIYRYMLFNNSRTTGPRIRFFPTPTEASAAVSTSAAITAASRNITVVDATGIEVDYVVSGDGIPEGTTVESISGLDITLSEEANESNLAAAVEFLQPKFQIFYIRNVYLPTQDCDLIDIPEFSNFIKQFVRTMCVKKEKLNPTIKDEEDKLQKLRELMIETLTEMVPDQDDRIEADFDAYMWSS